MFITFQVDSAPSAPGNFQKVRNAGLQGEGQATGLSLVEGRVGSTPVPAPAWTPPPPAYLALMPSVLVPGFLSSPQYPARLRLP